MVSALLIAVALFTAAIPAWGRGGQVRQLCLLCHPVHYVEHGRCVDCHRGNAASERKNIAHAGLREGKYANFMLGNQIELRDGQRLLDTLACRRCHVSGGRGNRLAVNLDSSVIRKSAGEIALLVRHPVANMPDFALTEAQITTLVNTLLAGSVGREMAVSGPVRVHFNTTGKSGADVFSRKCGSCHRLLSERFGASGTGAIGPNLSGLFSVYYPETFRNNLPWTGRRLSTWLKNPREIKPWSRMLPVALTAAEMKELDGILSITPGADR
ncbi:MAG: selenite/tellurite reduction operon c-type cytochrome lipoprotein ExtS [Desulfuromonadaceae bacterium]|nr:selenite/tellurite reduction operon c-type cytochrome lipoprotein ExtS [Desulfuromonadaceae bacterium]MDD2848741.1 selenite/tellurite reduction operon c-type cytochrome lipoprotein ExtS [Desulfuromonadaceae bacterium]MDD4130391.1 selenite/tellurite reduction operon c-type cytochrome lipoprotein ExtS [Desulfuromonadaceae bacterium]